jgi:hypothetical protein
MAVDHGEGDGRYIVLVIIQAVSVRDILEENT